MLLKSMENQYRGAFQGEGGGARSKPGATRGGQEQPGVARSPRTHQQKFTVQNRTIKTSLKQGFVISKGGVLSRGGARSSQEQARSNQGGQEQPGARRTPALLNPPPHGTSKNKENCCKTLKSKVFWGGVLITPGWRDDHKNIATVLQNASKFKGNQYKNTQSVKQRVAAVL